MEVRFGYAGFRGNRDEWQRFASGIFGFQSVANGELLLRSDERDWRIRIAEEQGPPVRFLGFELDSIRDVERLANRLETAGYAPELDDALAKERGVSKLLRVNDPDGVPLEFFVGGMTATTPFSSPLGVSFVTGRAGIGHVLISVSDLEKSLAFYMDAIGLNRSDILEMGDGLEGHFLNGGFRHHVVALAAVPGMVGLHHIFVEVDAISDVGRAWDRVQQEKVPIISRIGQHANDPALSFYVGSPSGFAFEYGSQSLIIDPAQWIEARWQAPFIWGGGPVPTEQV